MFVRAPSLYKGTHAAEDVARDKPSALCIFLFKIGPVELGNEAIGLNLNTYGVSRPFPVNPYKTTRNSKPET